MSESIEHVAWLDGREQPLDRGWIAVERIGRSIGGAILLGLSLIVARQGVDLHWRSRGL